MNRLDRALGMLLLLRGGKTISAAEFARRFEVSQRTIYRDAELLASAGVPIYAEMGRAGGFRLDKGYFLPPIMFDEGEATSLVVGLALLSRLRTAPFRAELETARQKLLAVIPDRLQTTLARMQQLIVFEALPHDTFHSGVPDPSEQLQDHYLTRNQHEDQILTLYLRAVIDHRHIQLDYRAPQHEQARRYAVLPRGLLWDRDYWYLVGQRSDLAGDEPYFWRADRVVAIRYQDQQLGSGSDEETGRWLGRRWLQGAMQRWREENPVVLQITALQAQRCQADWYYQHARFEVQPDGMIQMTFGEDIREVVFALVRWLGPGATLLQPYEWRQELQAQLQQMVEQYRG